MHLLIKTGFVFYVQVTFQSRWNKVKTSISWLYLNYVNDLVEGSKQNEFFASEQVSQKITVKLLGSSLEDHCVVDFSSEWYPKRLWDVLRDLVPFLQFKKRGKHPWKCVTFSKLYK